MARPFLKKLSHQHYKFVKEFCKIGVTGSEAAKRAGYTKKTAPVISCDLLKDPLIRDEIGREKDKNREELNVDNIDVITFLSKVLSANILDLYRMKDDLGNPTNELVFKNLEDIPRELGEIIKSIKPTAHGVHVEIYDKLTAISHLEKILDLNKLPENPIVKLIAEIVTPDSYYNMKPTEETPQIE